MEKKMKRTVHFLLIVTLALALIGAISLNQPAQAQEAPTGTWFARPYAAAEHNLSWVAMAVSKQISARFSAAMELPMTFYM
jgi:hypothetical protein